MGILAWCQTKPSPPCRFLSSGQPLTTAAVLVTWRPLSGLVEALPSGYFMEVFSLPALAGFTYASACQITHTTWPCIRVHIHGLLQSLGSLSAKPLELCTRGLYWEVNSLPDTCQSGTLATESHPFTHSKTLSTIFPHN